MHDSLMNTCTTSWASSNSACDVNVFRVRSQEFLSESRMREIRTSGLMRGRRGNRAR